MCMACFQFPEYREAFAADLKKSLPRIPIVEDIDAFLDFSYAGKATG